MSLVSATEDVMHKVRDGDWALTPGRGELLFSAIDALQALVNDVAAGGTGEADVTSTLEQLRCFEPEAEVAAQKKQTLSEKFITKHPIQRNGNI